jgi:hypothetical protein
VDGKAPSSPISGLRVSLIDLRRIPVRSAVRGAANSRYRAPVWDVSHAPPEPVRKEAPIPAVRRTLIELQESTLM